MKKPLNKQIENQVEDTLHSIEGIERASPAPYLLTRVKARLHQVAAERDSIWSRLGVLLSRPGIAFATLLLLLIINTVVISIAGNYNRSLVKTSVTTQRDEFAVNVLSIYEPEPNEP